jgi:hypothetical protein
MYVQCLLALLLVFLATSCPALEILCQSDAPFWKIPVPGNSASPGWITSTSGRLAVAVMVAALAAQRNVNGDSFVR